MLQNQGFITTLLHSYFDSSTFPLCFPNIAFTLYLQVAVRNLGLTTLKPATSDTEWDFTFFLYKLTSFRLIYSARLNGTKAYGKNE